METLPNPKVSICHPPVDYFILFILLDQIFSDPPVRRISNEN